MIPTMIRLAAPCADCGCEDGHLNSGNVSPGRYRAVRFGFAEGDVICKTCYSKQRYRHVIRPRKLDRRVNP